MPEAEDNGCPACGAALSKLGAKLSCTRCDVIVQAEAASRPIERGMAAPGLLAHVLVSKYSDHLPLYRQAEIYSREGVELKRSTLADWVGATSELVNPLLDALRQYVMSGHKLHADDTPVPVLAPGTGKTKLGRLWTYVRDDRPGGAVTTPAVWFAYSPVRRGEHPHRIWQLFTALYKPTVTLASTGSTIAAVFAQRAYAHCRSSSEPRYRTAALESAFLHRCRATPLRLIIFHSPSIRPPPDAYPALT